MWEERRKQDLHRLNGVNFRAMHFCAHTHAAAVKTEPARFWRVFGGLLPVLPVSRQKRPMRASQAVLITDVMVNVKNISLDKSFQEK